MCNTLGLVMTNPELKSLNDLIDNALDAYFDCGEYGINDTTDKELSDLHIKAKKAKLALLEAIAHNTRSLDSKIERIVGMKDIADTEMRVTSGDDYREAKTIYKTCSVIIEILEGEVE